MSSWVQTPARANISLVHKGTHSICIIRTSNFATVIHPSDLEPEAQVTVLPSWNRVILITTHQPFLITTTATPTPTTHTLDLLILLQLRSRHTADARAIEIGLLGLDAAEAAQLTSRHSSAHSHFQKAQTVCIRLGLTYLLIPLLLPFRDQVPIRVPVLQQPVVEGLADGFLFVVEVVDVARTCSAGNARS